MDDETKNFFERLSGINQDKEEAVDLEETIVNDEIGTLLTEETEGQLTVDVYETPLAFVVKSAVAGVNAENLEISIGADSVTVKGSREEEEKIKTDNYLQRECYWGKFSRSIILPQEIDPDRAQASLKNGILKISLPKVNKTKTKKLKVKFE
ncbi:Hsp20/alpha crystallin family protein [Candidatus Wolfebacteria bacterium]|nr:Hsp20/alpha crystallin family protein [Candidatus Wolfebacteria bacterium]